MSNVAIKFENISKRYRIGTLGTGTLSHDLKRWWITKIRGRDDPYLKINESNDRSIRGTNKHVWALRDINLEIKQGEVLGIIGKNGAGKSTLLKLLSRVTAPTTGLIKAKGRIASLLEIGTGFHPEMTGRENIYMNGSIMGMTKAEITRKLDEIVDFAGIAKYIDTPVKRFSSGMTVRLGFAVAAHMDPEILVVDEVLAVGDAEFQKKAIGKMQDISKGHGRTILFVSHNMQAISALTTQTILLFNGMVEKKGEANSIINYYLTKREILSEYVNNTFQNQPFIKKVKVKTSHNGNIHELGKELRILFEIYSPFPMKSPALSYQIYNSNEQPIIHVLNLYDENPFCGKEGTYSLESILPNCKLYPDTYFLVVHFADKITKIKYECIKNICKFEVKVFSELRDYYWYPKHATYIEENRWVIKKI